MLAIGWRTLYWLPLVAVLAIQLAGIHGSFNLQSSPQEGDFRVISANTFYFNQNTDGLQTLLALDPDVLFIHEANNAWIEAISAQIEYPTRAWTQAGVEGVAILSKHETHIEDTFIYDQEMLTLNLPGLRILGVHPTAPVSRENHQRRNLQFQAISNIASNSKDPMLILGDFNSTVWNPSFKRMEKEGELRAAQRDFPLKSTWFSRSLLFGLPIDGALASPELKVTGFTRGPAIPGTDHFPIVVDLLQTQ